MSSSRIDVRPVAQPQQANYATLKQLVKEKGLLEKQPRYLMKRIVINLVMMGISLIILFSTDSMWIQVPNALFMAFIFGQFGFIAHDAGHRQGFRKTKVNDFWGLIHGNLFLGMSYGWWMDKHNQHHAHPNEHDMDPDIDFPMIAFSERDALKKRGLARFLVAYQAYLFFFLTLFESISLRFGSIEFLVTRKKWKYRPVEIVLIVLHFVWFFGLVFVALTPGRALVFILVQQAFFGFYLASVFAPNHKGMLVVDEEDKLDFMLQQILTARNVKAHPVVDFWYGGLNYQIEHHLFPSMAENKLREGQQIVKAFCKAHHIPYYETSVVRSYAEILQYLHLISAPLRWRPLGSSI